ncbi:MAG TPA: ATP-binding cassette domain-containing protein [Pyrinomonadaceae bacterium]|nr:ATP-binding cassette domain-containing protein [Pyrinomonadaceae bacterium]
MALSEVLIHTDGVFFRYRTAQHDLFRALNLEITRGEIVGILGESGSGKTTLLKLLAGLEQPTDGIIVRNCSTKGSFVFQAPVLLDWLNVRQNVLFPTNHSDAAVSEVSEALREVELQSDGDKYPRELSGGMRSRVQLARALYRRPEVLFLDEAFSALDEKLRHQLNMLLKRLRERYEFAAVMISHSVHEAVYLSDRILLLKKGDDGSTDVSEVIEGLSFSRRSRDVWDTPEFGGQVALIRQRMLDS